MIKKIKTVAIVFLTVLTLGIIYVFTYVPDLSDQYGIVESKLYLGNSDKQPLVVVEVEMNGPGTI
jgi:hypothetical protein